MDVIHTIEALQARLRTAGPVAFVPTMGNLHAGHLALVCSAHEHGDCVVASIFVNPLQFGPTEDFQTYPRTLDADCAQLNEAGADVVFAPSVAEMYPTPQQVEIVPPPIASELCGAFRPGHFQGVTTVVAKLFNIVQPAVAVFGKKDFQQLFVIRAMVRELNFPVRVIGAETLRAEDGLALSSRNGYLSAQDRQEAPRLYRALCNIADQLKAGARDFAALEGTARQALESNGWRVDYVSVRDASTLLPPVGELNQCVILGAAWLGTTRLIDNIEVSIAALI
ncbi:MAG: pantoate--beta-alanine ligase [Betaproteobacteria bacterium RBG_19FT_COMBO_58_11]|nr:MAG: pantoate--beta-alanine ligase [Betaproteobacteria bacterium RBG_19FT_COMBO_58_11]